MAEIYTYYLGTLSRAFYAITDSACYLYQAGCGMCTP